jgi:transposase InsO family protein
MSGFVEFNECSEATAEMVLAALMDWFSRFGVVYTWVTDQGTHFKNQLIEHLRKQLGAHHHFTLPYCPWSNGTVEVVNRLLLRCLKALLSERKMQESEWPKLLKLVQMALNGRPSPRLKNQAPVTAMTALPADGLMKAIVKTKPVQVDDVQVVWSKQQEHMEHLCTSLELMHRECAEESEKLRKQARLRREKKSSVHNINFQEGDFVLVAAVGAHANKLAATWKGPRRIVQALSEYVYEVQNLIAPYEVTKHHVSRIHPYAESKRGVTEDLIEQAQHSQGGHYVESIVDCRIGPNSHDWEMQIKWVGLDPEEASWEPAKIIFEDIPKIVELWCDQQKDNPKVQAMWNTLQGKERLWKTVEKASKAKRKGGK